METGPVRFFKQNYWYTNWLALKFCKQFNETYCTDGIGRTKVRANRVEISRMIQEVSHGAKVQLKQTIVSP